MGFLRTVLADAPWTPAVVSLGYPVGFLIVILGEVLTILILTYMIGLGGLSHVVAGSTELFVLVLRGDLGPFAAVGKAILPAFLGNALGGTGMSAVLTRRCAPA